MNWHVDDNFSMVLKYHKYGMADQLIKRYRVSEIFSPIFYTWDILVPTPGAREERLIAPVIAIAALYWTDSIFFGKWCIGRLVINHICITKERSYERFINSTLLCGRTVCSFRRRPPPFLPDECYHLCVHWMIICYLE